MTGVQTGLRQIGRSAAEILGFDHAELATIAPYADLPPWQSSLPVAELAMDAVAVASLAMNVVSARRGALPAGKPIQLRADQVAASFGSERLFRIDGEPPSIWSPLSGFFRSGDGWVRTHGNYPHHARRLLALLDLKGSPEHSLVASAIERRTSLDLEEEAHNSGALICAVRSAQEWRGHPHARALAATPLIGRNRRDNSTPRPWPAARNLPLAGIRVLDLTRVIAGPVATRDLAQAGADVLRVDSPSLPEATWQYLDTGQGKRSTLLDLGRTSDRRDFDRLLTAADIIVLGYRPGALTRFGLESDSLTEKYPGIIVAELSAWGATGPWSNRRGFDSLVQAATGVSLAEGGNDEDRPGALPVQALDHSAGHLLAAAIATALVQQRSQGGSFDVSINLARIAHELLGAERESVVTRDNPSIVLPTTSQVLRPSVGTQPAVITSAAPALTFAGASDRYPNTGTGWGMATAKWKPLVQSPGRRGRAATP